VLLGRFRGIDCSSGRSPLTGTSLDIYSALEEEFVSGRVSGFRRTERRNVELAERGFDPRHTHALRQSATEVTTGPETDGTWTVIDWDNVEADPAREWDQFDDED